MKILALSWGGNSSAALLIDGKVVGAVSEERFTRRKNESVFPVNAIKWLLAHASLAATDLDVVGIASLEGGFDYILTQKYSNYSIADHVRDQHDFWRPRLYDGKNLSYPAVFKDKVCTAQYPEEFWKKAADGGYDPHSFNNDRIGLVAGFLGISAEKVRLVEHHTCHASYGYYGSPFRGKPALVLTIDAHGDGLNMTISETTSKGIERRHSSSNFNIGRLYRSMTLVLGMKPDEHEYKIMGLAPYAKAPVMKKAREVFDTFQAVDGIDFRYVKKPKDLYFHFRDSLEGARFDGIAGALQAYVEDCLCAWIKNVIEKFGIGRLVLSGGVSMNIKAMGKLLEMPEVEELFICGSGSDDSLPVGACYALAAEWQAKGGHDIEPGLTPLKDLYLGPEPGDSSPEAVRRLKDFRIEYRIHSNPTVDDAVKLLSAGKVIARCIGRGEFGARALGNRSILADPRDAGIIRVINDKIKSRDFWMPFAPMIKDTHVPRYLVNPKKALSPHMTIGFESTAEGRAAIPAALHPADFTARPQMVTPAQEQVYALLSAFEKATGVGGLLNTSFNLHGYPIVNTVEDAMHVFANSELDALWLEHSLVLKPSVSL